MRYAVPSLFAGAAGVGAVMYTNPWGWGSMAALALLTHVFTALAETQE